jgi:hypothetical protein
MVLPFATASQRRSLVSTASPAAQELTRTQFVRLKATESAAAQQISKLSSAHATAGQSDGTALEARSEDEPMWKVCGSEWTRSQGCSGRVHEGDNVLKCSSEGGMQGSCEDRWFAISLSC